MIRQHTSRWTLLTGPLIAVLVGSGLASVAAPTVAAAPAAVAVSSTRDVMANLFEWNWNSVAGECTNVLGPLGYGGVQVAPPQESLSLTTTIPAHPWWEVYQPVSYQLTSRMGTRAQFAEMVTACHNAGVKVYADAVLNHMTGHANGAGYAGSAFSEKYAYPSLYSYHDFHHYPGDCPNSNGQVSNYNSQIDVQECELLGLADLRTESDQVRGMLAAYLNDLMSLGVDGFRLDAAKHINIADIAAIESKLAKPAFIYQEVIPNGVITPTIYQDTGSVLEFTYAQQLRQQFQGNISNLRSFGQSWGLQPASKSVTFVDNHDTDRNGSTLSYKDGATYTLATIFHLAWGYGTPQVYASFAFSNNDQSPPADNSGMVTGTDCANGAWVCTDRNQVILGMVGWHNAVAGTPVANWWSDGRNAIAFGRGSSGFVVINNDASAATRRFATGLPAGRYCDVVHGQYTNGSCTGPVVTVDGSGWATVAVAGHDAVAFDVAARRCG